MAQELVDRKRIMNKTKGTAGRRRPRFRPIKSAPTRRAKTIDHTTSVDESFPVVGIGASAGGLEAFTQLLRELPPDINMALVLVQHLDPTYKSLLTELLSKTTKLLVAEVTDGMQVKPRHVYVIPPNTSMTISKFFFSSRRRHTICYRDWSSDVCSSDLGAPANPRCRPAK